MYVTLNIVKIYYNFQIQIHPEKYFENTLNVLQFLSREEQKKVGQQVNKTQWQTYPAIVVLLLYNNFVFTKLCVAKELRVTLSENVFLITLCHHRGSLGNTIIEITKANIQPIQLFLMFSQNAFYSRSKNQIMFPAGILQPPFYHRHFPK